MKLFDEQDCAQHTPFTGKTAIIGYGSQGRAHAMNLRDSGFDVTVGLRPGGATWAQAEADGFTPAPIAEATKGAKIVAILVPDTAQAKVFTDEIEPNLAPDATVLFAHGFNVLYGEIEVPAGRDITLVAPKSPGAMVRREYENGRGVPCLFAIERDTTGEGRGRTLAYAHGLGCARAGALETTFKEETETDLFGEQAVLCGGATELVAAGFETLVEAGYQPELAYFECLHELKLIVDLLYEGGFARMHRFISDTAKYGDLSRGPRIVDDATRARMREILGEIRSGTFAREWLAEDSGGRSRYDALLAKDLAHPIEETGKRLRERMKWLEEAGAAKPAPQAAGAAR